MASAAVAPPAVAEVHTAVADVRACLPLDDGGTAVATGGGLLLLDGLGRRSLLTALDGLPETRVHAVAAAGAGELWVGTEGGLARVRLSAGRASVQRTVPSPPVRALLVRGAALYVGTWGGGLLVLDQPAAPARAVPFAGPASVPRQRLTALALHRGALFAGTAGAGLYRLERGALHAVEADLPSAVVWSLAIHGDRLLVGTLAGLVPLGTTTARLWSAADVRGLAVAGDELLVGSFGEGVLAGRGAPPALRRVSSATARFITSVGPRCLTADGRIWRRRTTGEAWREIRLGGLGSGDISALAQDGRRLWAGSFDRGLALLERGRWRRVLEGAIDPQVNALALEGTSGRLFVATARGLHIVEERAGALRQRRLGRGEGLPSEDIHALAPLRRGGMLIGTSRGAVVLRDQQMSIVGPKQGLVISAVWAVAEGADGALWLGTGKGLFRGWPGGRWERFSVASGDLGDDWVTALAVRRGEILAGTYNGGVVRLSRGAGGKLRGARLTAGWVNLGGLHLDGERLFVATMDGLLRCELGTAGPTCHAQSGAAPGRDVTAVQGSENGGLWVGSRRGIRRLAAGRSPEASGSCSSSCRR